MLHIKLFSVASPIPLPKWFRKGSDCCLRKKVMPEIFPSYIRNIAEVKNLPYDIVKSGVAFVLRSSEIKPQFKSTNFCFNSFLYFH